MCGILLLIRGVLVESNLELGQVNDVPSSEVHLPSELSASLHRRGPDHWGSEQVVLGPNASLQIQGSLLQLRGISPGVTPVKDSGGNMLVLNGEIFGGLDIAPGANDSRTLLHALSSGTVPHVFNCLRGPWAAVYWHAHTCTLWFGRDVLGRRSLLMHLPVSSGDCFCLVSAAGAAAGVNMADGYACDGTHPSTQQPDLQELPPGLYSMCVPAATAHTTGHMNGHMTGHMAVQVQHHPWQDRLLRSIRDFERPPSFVTPQPAAASASAGLSTPSSSDLGSDTQAKAEIVRPVDIQPEAQLFSDADFAQAVDVTLKALARAVAVRCQCIDQHAPHLPSQSSSADHNTHPLHHMSCMTHNTAQSDRGQATHAPSGLANGPQAHGAALAAPQTSPGAGPLAPEASSHVPCKQAAVQQPASSVQQSASGSGQPRQGQASALQTAGDQTTQQSLQQDGQTCNSHSPRTANTQKAESQTLLQPAAVSTTGPCHPHSSCSQQDEPNETACQQTEAGSHQALAPLQPAPVLILFSGGVDSTLIAALAHQSLPVGVPIDLASVCFNGGKSADRLAAQDAVLELVQFAPSREWRLILVDASLEEVDQHRSWLLGLLYPSATVMDLNIGAALWMAARAEGRVTVFQGGPCHSAAPTCSQAVQELQSDAVARLSVLVLPDAVQNAHEGSRGRTGEESAQADEAQTRCADAPQPTLYGAESQNMHETGWQPSCEHSSVLGSSESSTQQADSVADAPNRAYYQQTNSAHTAAAVHQTESEPKPQNLAEPGFSQQHQQDTAAPASSTGGHAVQCEVGTASYEWYKSAARVVLLGHGADEQHAGYGRHRTSFRNQGWAGLQEELAIDMRRLWQRNLGRDDRLVADTSREARHPFLDEEYINSVLQLPLWLIADLAEVPGQGDKKLLRAALRQLGLPRAAARVKRAIQFGTGIGKLSNVRSFGSNRAANSQNAGSLNLSTLLR